MKREREIAYDLKAEREAAELSQVQMAEILFVNQSQISRWEKNGNMPKVYQVVWRTWKEKKRA